MSVSRNAPNGRGVLPIPANVSVPKDIRAASDALEQSIQLLIDRDESVTAAWADVLAAESHDRVAEQHAVSASKDDPPRTRPGAEEAHEQAKRMLEAAHEVVVAAQNSLVTIVADNRDTWGSELDAEVARVEEDLRQAFIAVRRKMCELLSARDLRDCVVDLNVNPKVFPAHAPFQVRTFSPRFEREVANALWEARKIGIDGVVPRFEDRRGAALDLVGGESIA